MGSTFFELVDMGLSGSPMGLLGLPSPISYFTLFNEIFIKKNQLKLNIFQLGFKSVKEERQFLSSLKQLMNWFEVERGLLSMDVGLC